MMAADLMQQSIVYYITAHGYGHGARSTDILRALAAARPDLPIIVTTDLPEVFIRNRLNGAKIQLRRGAFDVGMVQLDSIRVDVAATLRKALELQRRWESLVQAETRFLQEQGAELVVSDIAAIPLVAAKSAGIPALAMSNFAWDWIYSEFVDLDPAWKGIVEQFAAGYAQADLLLRLPFAEPMQAFPRKEDVSLLATPGQARRRELAELTGANTDKRWVLLSFTSLEWGKSALRRLQQYDQYEFFSVLPLAWPGSRVHAVDAAKISFADTLASADVVISKPGFGLVSECIVNHKPLIYADRSQFAEYRLLEEGIKRYLQAEHIPQEKLYAGDLAEALANIWQKPQPRETLAVDGAQTVVQRIEDHLP